MMSESVLVEARGPLGILTLNRPSALNALNLEMLRALRGQLDAWVDDPAIHAVILRGGGERAFCSGGDVRAIALALPTERRDDPDRLSRRFFREEYALNHRIHHYPKPFVSLVDRVCMGGGLGVSAHGSHRVVTERLVLAMPETAIGFFPDVGGGWFLPRFPGQTGTYLGLTGARSNAADARWLGYATDTIASEKLDDALAALTSSSWDGVEPFAQVTRILAAFSTELGPAQLEQRRALIDRCFRFDTIEEISRALEAEADAFARETREQLLLRCPFSLAATLRQLRLGATLEYDRLVHLEYRMSQALAARADFREGIRAVLIDKDHRPRWSPPTLGEVDAAEVEACFADSGGDPLELVPPGTGMRASR